MFVISSTTYKFQIMTISTNKKSFEKIQKSVFKYLFKVCNHSSTIHLYCTRGSSQLS